MDLITRGEQNMSDPIAGRPKAPPKAAQLTSVRSHWMRPQRAGIKAAAAYHTEQQPLADGATTEVETAVESEAEAAAHTRRDEQQVYATRVAPSACACTCGGGNSQLVYALGRLAYDFGTEARRDSIAQHMGDRGDEANPWDQRQMLDYLEKNPW